MSELNISAVMSTRTWLTAQSMADLVLCEFPITKQGVNRRLRECSIPEHLVRRRKSVGGGFEYHYMCLPIEAIMDFEGRFARPEPAYDALALGGGASTLETAEGGKLFAFLRRLHVHYPELPAASIRHQCVELFGNEVTAFDMRACGLRRFPMPPLSAFRRILADVRSYYSLGVATRRLGFDRVFDRFARSKLCVAIGEQQVLELEERIRGMMIPTIQKTKATSRTD